MFIEVVAILVCLFFILRIVLEKKLFSKNGDFFDTLHKGFVVVDKKGYIYFSNREAQVLINSKKPILRNTHVFSLESSKEFCTALEYMIFSCMKKKKMIQKKICIDVESERFYEITVHPWKVNPRKNCRRMLVMLKDMPKQPITDDKARDFLANASHEIKTPISVIHGFAEILQNRSLISEEKVFEISKKIMTTSQRLGSIIKNLLTLSEVENLSDQLFSEYDISSILDNCKYLLISMYPSANVEIHNKTKDLKIFAKRGLLEVAFMNLLENAVRYSQKNAQITIEIKEWAKEVVISIKDQGIGISSDQLEHIFEKFYSANKILSKKQGGTGLGLSIVKTIVEKHNGEIEVSSKQNQGTTFTITLPQTGKSHIERWLIS